MGRFYFLVPVAQITNRSSGLAQKAVPAAELGRWA